MAVAVILTVTSGILVIAAIRERAHRQRAIEQRIAAVDRLYAPGPHRLPAEGLSGRAPVKPDPMTPIFEAYNGGHYDRVISAASRVANDTSLGHNDLKRRVQARWVLAYAKSRQHHLAEARAQFALAQREASQLPDHGLQPANPGEAPATIESEAAFEHAVCTAALGDARTAEAEYVDVMRRYPDSPYVYAAIKRIDLMHHGNAPVEAEAVFENARKVALAHQNAIARDNALCGPECLAELLRRRGETASIEQLARQMRTTGDGTSLQDLANCARQYGFLPRGWQLTTTGLAKRKLPAIALVAMGHYVLVDAVTPSQITIWDPDANGIGKGATLNVPSTKFAGYWRGVTLTLFS